MLPDMPTAETDMNELVRSEAAGLGAYLRFLGADRSTAEDLVQESFLTVLRHPDRARGRVPGAFLRGIARRLLQERLRNEGRRERILMADAAQVIWERRIGEHGHREWLEGLRACLEGLDARSRELVDLHYRESLSHAEIARRAQLAEGHVGVLIHRARAVLAACLQRKVKP